MSMTLNLVEVLLGTARNLVLMGRFTEALVPLAKLAAFRDLPAHVLEEICTLRADVFLAQENYKDARRNLTAAIAARPLDANHHYHMAVAIDEDEDTDRTRAEAYYREAVKLEPDNPVFWLDLGVYLLTQDKRKDGLRAIRKAFTLATTDAEIVGRIAQVLRDEGHAEEATAKLRAALFANHGAQAFRLLCQQHQFALIYEKQNEPRANAQGEPVILPFTPGESQGKYLELGGKTIRFDQAEPLEEPKTKVPAPSRRPPRKG